MAKAKTRESKPADSTTTYTGTPGPTNPPKEKVKCPKCGAMIHKELGFCKFCRANKEKAADK